MVWSFNNNYKMDIYWENYFLGLLLLVKVLFVDVFQKILNYTNRFKQTRFRVMLLNISLFTLDFRYLFLNKTTKENYSVFVLNLRYIQTSTYLTLLVKRQNVQC